MFIKEGFFIVLVIIGFWIKEGCICKFENLGGWMRNVCINSLVCI